MMRMTMMTGLERLKMICEAPHADGVIRLTRERLRGITWSGPATRTVTSW